MRIKCKLAKIIRNIKKNYKNSTRVNKSLNDYYKNINYKLKNLKLTKLNFRQQLKI